MASKNVSALNFVILSLCLSQRYAQLRRCLNGKASGGMATIVNSVWFSLTLFLILLGLMYNLPTMVSCKAHGEDTEVE